jgi:hypothetical protein
VQLALVNDPSSSTVQWIRTREALLNLLTQDDWLGVAKACVGPSGGTTLVVQDAGESRLCCRGWVVRGPGATGTGTPVEVPVKYVESWLRDDRADLPPPIAFVVTERSGLDSLEPVMHDIAFALTWVWVAAEVHAPADEAPVVRFEGARVVEVPVRSGNGSEVENAVALWEWAIETSAPSRREAIQQAVSLAVRDEKDFAMASASVLRTAKYLVRISEQGLVAEALAARRGARDAATGTARSTADAARDVARKAADRVAIQIGAAAGVVIANRQAFIETSTATFLLWVLLGLVAATATVALAVELRSASDTLAALSVDLGLYRETLPDEDIDVILGMQTVRDAKRLVVRSSQVVYWLLVAAAIAIAAGIEVVS